MEGDRRGRPALQAERRVGSEVAARLEAIGADRAQWPAAAREEAQRLDARAASLASMLSAAQAAADQEAAAARTAQRQQVHSLLLPPLRLCSGCSGT